MTNLVSFEPVKLLDKILIVCEIDVENQAVILSQFRNLVRNRLTSELAVTLQETEVFNGDLEKISQGISQSAAPKKAQKILTVVLLAAFSDVVNNLLEAALPEQAEKINQILDQDKAFSTIYDSWQKNRPV